MFARSWSWSSGLRHHGPVTARPLMPARGLKVELFALLPQRPVVLEVFRSLRVVNEVLQPATVLAQYVIAGRVLFPNPTTEEMVVPTRPVCLIDLVIRLG